MKACWCTLAGTRHCLYCSNNNSFDWNQIPVVVPFPVSEKERVPRRYTYSTTATSLEELEKKKKEILL